MQMGYSACGLFKTTSTRFYTPVWEWYLNKE
jgi:hypothetical protein